MLDTKSILSEKMLIPLCMDTFTDRWGLTGLVWGLKVGFLSSGTCVQKWVG